MVNNTQTIRRLLAVADELFESVWPLCGVGAWRIKKDDRTKIKNDGLVSLINMFSKIYKKYIHNSLRILTGKKHGQLNFSAYKKYRYGHLGQWYIKSTLLKRFLNWKKSKVLTAKAPFFVIGPFCAHHSICLNIGLWYDSFVWKWCVFNLRTSN